MPPSSTTPSRRVQLSRALGAALLGLTATLLLACGSSSKGLIPASDAGPLQSDFETVQQAAENGDGNCATTEAALLKTNEDLTALPSTVDAGLRNNLRQGVANLRVRALALCAQPLPQTTPTTETPKPTTTATTPTTTTPPTTSTSTTTTPPATTPTTPTPGGGTPAPGAGETPPAGGNEQGNGPGDGGNRAGGAGPGEGGGQEGGK